jgi:hypothetical protein
VRGLLLVGGAFVAEAVLARAVLAIDASAALLSPHPETAAPAAALLVAMLAARAALLFGAPVVAGRVVYRAVAGASPYNTP